MSDKKHATLAPSAAKRWTNCAGSIAFLADIPEPVTSPAAAEGTRAHALLEHCLRLGMWDAKPLVGKRLASFKATEPVVCDSMSTAVTSALEYVRPMIEAAGAKLLIETRVHMRRVDPTDCFGTGDIAILGADLWLDAVDYKHGVGVTVEAEDNKQLTLYAIGFMELYAAIGVEIEGVRMHVVQPRRRDGAGPQMVTLSKLDLLDATLELRAAARATKKPDAKLTPGPWCNDTFCKGRATCPALRAAATKTALADMGGKIDVNALSAAEIGERLRQVPMLKSWIKAIEELAFAEASAGRVPESFKWVQGRGQRVWAESEVETIRALARLSNSEFAPRKLLSVAQAEEVLGKTAKGESFKALWRKQSGARVLAPAEDPRPALADTAKGDFDVISID